MIRYSFIAIILFFTSCSTDLMEIEEPKNLISKPKMIRIMKELVKLEAYIQGSYPSVSEYNKSMLNSSDTLFKRLNVKSDDFEASIDYYGSHQEQMKEIYDEVLDELNSELGELQSKEK
mgnify:FL=1|jgi:hypothetical protein